MAIRTRNDDERPFFDLVRCEYWDESAKSRGFGSLGAGSCAHCPVTGATFPEGEPVMRVSFLQRVPGQLLLFYDEIDTNAVVISARDVLMGKIGLSAKTWRYQNCRLLGAKANQDIELLRLSID